MSAAELDEATLAVLRPLAAADQLNILLGAGASAGVGLPDWDTLVVRLLQRSGVFGDEATARAFLARQDPQLAVEAARQQAENWNELLRRCLYDPPGDSVAEGPVAEDSVSEGEAQPGVLHWATAELAADRPLGDVGLFTLNYDLLLETALDVLSEDLGQGRSVFSRGQGSPRARREQYEVHHLHGLMEPQAGGRAEGVVLTLKDYSELNNQERPWQVAALQNALEHGPLVLAGTSYRDPDVRRWMHQLTQLPATGSAVMIILAREAMGLTREQFAHVRATVTTQWSAIGVQALLVQDHADAAQALRELPALREADYRTPQQRAADLLQRHLDDFTHLQDQHAAQLDADLGDLRAHLGADANLTLWLADGQGRLARWAANDRVHRAPRHLRYVPSGHDSPWLAGQCLASEAMLINELTEGGTTRRWRSVVAVPVPVEVPGGPAFSAAALSSATSSSLEDCDPDEWRMAMETLSQQWSERLKTVAEARQ
ncbi:hypothetical protein GCM10027586_00350 [Kineococcus gypseus]|uniref:SIR2 family protein n=1 Tax=Kineococcus gypseus TaxID=1637102 RepID=UPI003D7D730F